MKKIMFRRSDKGGWEYSDDGGKMWYFTYRTIDEIRLMKHAVIVGGESPAEDNEDRERELFGETLDEEIPDDLWAMI